MSVSKMEKTFLIFIAFSLFKSTVQELTPDAACGTDPGTSRGLKISLRSVRNQTGVWVDNFTARAENSYSSDIFDVDVTHKLTECQGKMVIYIQGVSKANPVESFNEREKREDKLTFHPRCGKNVAVLASGRTVEKLKLETEYNSSVFTNRPLKDNEIFEVMMDKKNEKLDYSSSIGVITKTPDDIDILPDMHKSPFIYLYRYNKIFTNSTELLRTYGESIQKLRIGDRVGVMRNQVGTLHFFINGVDQGPAVYNVTSPVYGMIELRGTVAMATIV